MSLSETLADLESRTGEEIHVSDWVDVTQEMINEFGHVTGDQQWIHTDPERARKESPFGGPIAHGYLSLSLYPMLRDLVREDRPLFPGVRRVINYGINKLRFPGAVPAGSRVRARCVLVAAEEVKESLQITEQFTLEVEGQERPACVAECVMRVYF